MTDKKCVSEKYRHFENRCFLSHRFDSLFVSDIAPSQTIHPLER